MLEVRDCESKGRHGFVGYPKQLTVEHLMKMREACMRAIVQIDGLLRSTGGYV